MQTSDGPSLESLLRRLAQSRDAEAWAGLLDLAGPEMLRLCRRLTGDETLAEDAVHEALLLIRDHAGEFRASGRSPDSARGWVMRIASHAALQLLRQRQRIRRREARAAREVMPCTADDPAVSADRAETQAVLREQLAELPDRHRLPIALHFLAGLEYAQVAAALGCPIGTAKTLVARGLRQLRSRMETRGVALSAAALTATLQALDGGTLQAGVLASARELLLSSRAPTVRFSTHLGMGGLSMGLKAALISAALALTTGVVFLAAGDATVPTKPPAQVPAAPPKAAPKVESWRTMNVAVLGDIANPGNVDGMEKGLDILAGPGVDAVCRPDAIEIVTNVDLGPAWDRFEAFDRVVDLARRRGVKLYFRVKPHVVGNFEKSRVRETKVIRKGAPEYKENAQISYFDPAYLAAVKQYFKAVATRYAGEPLVLGFGVAIGNNGETQYPIDGTSFGDFSDAALKDYTRWMAARGVVVTGWPDLPAHVLPNTRLSRDATYYHWSDWRCRRIGELLGEVAREIKAVAPDKLVSAFSYTGITSPAAYGPGFLEDDPNIDWFFGSISLDHGLFAVRGQDRSRPAVVAGRKLVAGEFDLISAYTDRPHMEAFVRYFFLMHGQPRPFLPRWWSPTSKGGWAESFWTQYSDDLAREMSRLVNANRTLADAQSVADVAVIVPNVSAMGVMAAWGPWTSEEFRANHSDIARHLSAIGANFDLITEDTLSAAKLKPYKLVVVLSPALYPWVRSALTDCRANVLAMGWAGTVVVPEPAAGADAADAWNNGKLTWWPTRGTVVQRPARIQFKPVPLAGELQKEAIAAEHPEKPLTYVRGMEGTAIATDDEGKAVVAVTDWNGRRVYHFGLPIRQQNEAGRLLSDAQFQRVLSALLRDAGCTAYDELGSLRLFETDRWLLIENPNGTEGTPAEPRGDFEGELQVRTRHTPAASSFDARTGKLKLTIPAGKSILIPLKP